MDIIDKGTNNTIIGNIKGKVTIEGNNNKVIADSQINNINFLIQGNNNIIHIKENVAIFKRMDVTITGNESKLEINRNTTMYQVYILINEDRNKIKIGEDCMFSDNVRILASDSHSIISTTTGKCINAHKDGVIIGNHVWIGMNALILKDVKIGDNSIVAAGTVISAKYEGSYGNLVKIDHGNGVETWYAHTSKMYVKAGQKVEAGDVIAAVGSTGNSTGPHLHLEIRVNGEHINPQKYLYN